MRRTDISLNLVKEFSPHIDGALLDNVVDYLKEFHTRRISWFSGGSPLRVSSGQAAY